MNAWELFSTTELHKTVIVIIIIIIQGHRNP
jgi:hypothetical protein